ncbi:MAG: efflux RND transporter periplasmic adaptor subunit [Myxococcota bacterium]
MKPWFAALLLFGCSSAAPEPVAAVDAAPTKSERAPAKPIVDADPGYAGVVLPSVAVDLAPTYEGKIEALHVAVGQRVVVGAPVATFDPAAAQEALEIARAEVRIAKGAAGEAAAAAKHARQRLATEQSLFAQGITAADNVSSARADRAQAGAASSSAAGQIAAAKARVEQLERQLQDMALTAPFTGTVAAVYREGGALASPAQPVLRLIDTHKSFVRFAVPPADRTDLAVGRLVDVQLDWVDTPLTATVRDIAPEIDAPTGMIFVEAELTPDSVGKTVPNSPVWVSPQPVS